MQKRIRVLVAKPGLDGHDRGVKVIAKALGDAGMEVIYGGLRQTPEQIANSAIQEDVDVIGLSILSGAHKVLTKELMDLLKEKNAEDISVIVGGIIPKQDIIYLQDIGVKAVFGPGTDTRDTIAFIKNLINESEV